MKKPMIKKRWGAYLKGIIKSICLVVSSKKTAIPSNKKGTIILPLDTDFDQSLGIIKIANAIPEK